MDCRAYYNEIDPCSAEWLRELIKAGHIAPGDVDTRSIADVEAVDLIGYTQHHFFAGIGGWSYALRLAGWPDDRPVWTGSCPCQPFSASGKRKGKHDERHLWPEFYRLIKECRPDTVFGEQVAAAIGLDWLDHVSDDLEAIDYACGAVVLPACSVGAPHIRQRLWFVADSGCPTGEWNPGSVSGEKAEVSQERELYGDMPVRSTNGRTASELGNTNGTDGPRFGQFGFPMEPEQESRRSGNANPWEELEFVGCADGKARPTKPGLFPLAHGVSGRVGLLRGYGNAIVPQVAAEVIRAYMTK